MILSKKTNTNFYSQIMSSYREFDVSDNREIRWYEHGTCGPNMYYFVPIRMTFADVATHDLCILGGYIPSEQETIVPSEKKTQRKEELKEIDRSMIPDPSTRSHKKHRQKTGHRQNNKKGKSRRKPDELDHDYYREFYYGYDVDDFYYRPDMINEYDYYDQFSGYESDYWIYQDEY